MTHPAPPHDPVHSRTMVDEADIGSGEKPPGQQETDALIRQIPPLPADGAAEQARPDPGKTPGSGRPGKS